MAHDPEQDAWVRRVLGVDPGGEDDVLDPGALADLGLDLGDMWAVAREAFQQASAQVDAQIGALQTALRDSDDLDYDEIAEFGLNGLTGNTRVSLQAAIMELGTGDVGKLKAGAQRLLQAVTAFRVHLASDPRIEACDENPLDVPVSIRETFGDALDQLASVARAAERT